MRTILSLRRHQYLKRVGIFLIAIALIVGIVSCNGDGVTYDLTMAENPAAGGTATDLTGASPYTALTAVNISAVAASCYRFVDWTAPAGAFANANAAQTTFIMPGRNVTVTANFELTPPDHFKFYGVDEKTAPDVGEVVQLVDQFGAINATVGEAWAFGNPVQKDEALISDPNRHYTLYYLDYDYEVDSVTRDVEVSNQFQDKVELTVWGPVALAVPTQKEDHEPPVCLDHFLVYEVLPSSWLEEPMTVVDLHDQFQDQPEAEVWDPVYFATPVEKTHKGEVTEVMNEDEHMVFYDLDGASFSKTVQIVDQFGEPTLDLIFRDTLAVPSEKISWGKPLDHFKCYTTLPGPSLNVTVELEDQFLRDSGGPIYTNVLDPISFCNPAAKLYEEDYTPIASDDHHFTIYNLDYEHYGYWEVWVDNQFGFGELQVLYVEGPVALAVPTWKLFPGDHEEPVGLDHYLLYKVTGEPTALQIAVQLKDQFGYDSEVLVTEPAYFANPVQKTYKGEVTEVVNEDDHLVFYNISSTVYEPTVVVSNQFVTEQPLDVLSPDLLAVPSEKLDWGVPQ